MSPRRLRLTRGFIACVVPPCCRTGMRTGAGVAPSAVVATGSDPNLGVDDLVHEAVIIGDASGPVAREVEDEVGCGLDVHQVAVRRFRFGYPEVTLGVGGEADEQ